MPQHSHLKSRLEKLTSAQRDLLADRLGVRTPIGRHDQLIACVVPRNPDQTEIVSTELKSYLGERLPPFMLPSLLVAVDHIPRLPNGKIDRTALTALVAELNQPEPVVGSGRTPQEQVLTDIWSLALGIDPDAIGIHDNFFELGGDSITSIHIISKARAAGLQIDPKEFMENPTIAALASAAKVQADDHAPTASEPLTGEVPLTPIQHWFLELDLVAPHQWNQAVLCELSPSTDRDALENALQSWLTQHDMLRAGLEPKEDGGWKQWVRASGETPPQTRIDLQPGPRTDQLATIDEAMSKLQAELRFDGTPLIQLALFETNSSPVFLGIIIHHLITDAISWEILLEDLQTAYRDATALPPRTNSYQAWAHQLRKSAATERVQRDADYWLRPAKTSLIEPFSSNANPTSHPTEGTVVTRTVRLNPTDSAQLLSQANSTYHTSTEDLILTALACTIGKVTNSPAHSIRVGMEKHGRDSDVARTAGWFTTYFPVNLQLPPAQDLEMAIKSIKEQIREVPAEGRTFGILKYLSPDVSTRESFRNLPDEQLLFNYLGSRSVKANSPSAPGELIQAVRAFEAASRAPQNRRSHPLEINAQFEDNTLQSQWIYDPAQISREVIDALTTTFVQVLQEIIAHCTSTEGGFTPSDFPEVDLDQESLDDLLDGLDD